MDLSVLAVAALFGLVVAAVFARVFVRWRAEALLRELVGEVMHRVPMKDLFSHQAASRAYKDVRMALRAGREQGVDPLTIVRRLEIYASAQETGHAQMADHLGRQALNLRGNDGA